MFPTESASQVQQRHLMVRDQLRSRGVADERVLQTMEKLPRQHFIPPENHSQAYLDQPVAIGAGQTISQPYIVALMTEKLRLQPQHCVLEIGTGCGYQTAILAQLVDQVYTIELIETLALGARQNLDAMEITNVHYHIGNGCHGWPEDIFFDRILVAAAASTFPPLLVKQLADQGKMVVPVGTVETQELLLLEKHGEKLKQTLLCYCRFVRLVEQ